MQTVKLKSIVKSRQLVTLISRDEKINASAVWGAPEAWGPWARARRAHWIRRHWFHVNCKGCGHRGEQQNWGALWPGRPIAIVDKPPLHTHVTRRC